MTFRSAVVVLLALSIPAAHAQQGDAQSTTPGLRLSPLLRPPAAAAEGTGTVFLRADRLQGEGNRRLEASGSVDLRSHFESFSADWLSYDVEADEIHARGNVRVRRGNDTVTGPEVFYRRDAATGFFTAPDYSLGELGGRGSARAFEFTGPGTYVARDASYTTCRADDDSWYVRVGTLEIDRGREVASGRDASVVFKGLPLFYAPWFSFPLGNERKSGFLTPSLGSTGNRGLEFRTPYYLNLAENYDATLTPRVMTRRGIQLNGQFRYLFPTNTGELNAEYLPHDRATDDNRWGVSWRHAHDLGGGFGAYTNLNRVSDDTYFSDLGERISVTSQTTLPMEGGIAYNAPGVSVLARVQKFQTLQDPDNPVLPPYERVPQILLNAYKYDWHGFDTNLVGEITSFHHPTLATGDRLVLYPWASYSLRGPAHSVTGRLGVHMTSYNLDDPTLPESRVDRVVPIASIDAGLAFERDWTFRGTDFVQTLEPRAFYVYIPYRRQDQIPAFDTAIADLNFAQLFTENRYVGHDRINDANQITLALTSRLLDPQTGDERLRVAIGQRYYFEDQRVTLNEVPRSAKTSDLLFTIGGRISSAWFADLGFQYGTDESRLEQFNVLARYQPAPGRVLSMSYRYARDLIDSSGNLSRIDQVDFGAQWPLFGNFVGLARWNYSFYDKRILEGIAGVEYNGDCWVLRVVAHRIATATETATNSIFVQLELNGLSRIGTNPLDLLRRNIPGYFKINEPAPGSSADPVYVPRF